MVATAIRKFSSNTRPFPMPLAAFLRISKPMTRYAARYSAKRGIPVMGRNCRAMSITAQTRMRASIFFCFFVMENSSFYH